MTWNLFDRLLPSETDQTICIEKESGATLTYGELAALSGRFAGFLANKGVGPNHRVAAKVEKSVEAVALYLATLRAGAVYLPLNTAYTPAETEYFVRDAQPTLIVCDPKEEADLRAIAAKAGGHVETLDHQGKGSLVDAAAAYSADFNTMPRAKDDLAAILYTSGTTGRSKGAMLTHGNLISNALTLVEQWRFSHRDILIHALPIYHIHGLFVACNVTFAVRAYPVHAEIRRGPHSACNGTIDRIDGRADFLCPAASEREFERANDRQYEAVHRRICAAIGRDPPCLETEDWSRDPRTVRHDRDRHDRLQSVRRSAHPRLRRPPPARR